MASVATVNGTVDSAELGFTLMHEHVFIRSPGVFENWPHLWDEDGEIKAAIGKLNDAKASGVDTILDLTTVDLGRNIPLLQRVAQHVNLNIIVATGVWMRPPHHLLRMDADALAELFVRDVVEGIAGTGVRAGAIKIASEPVVDASNETMLRAAARAHRKTGAPISTHTYVRNKTGLTQQDIFGSEGVDLSRVVIGHSGDSEDLDYLRAIINKGSFIGMDRFGLERMLVTDRRIEVVAKMCELGHADRMVLSHDANCWMESLDPGARAQAMPNWHYLHIHRDIVPALLQRGVTQHQVDVMTRDNPRRLFEAQGSY